MWLILYLNQHANDMPETQLVSQICSFDKWLGKTRLMLSKELNSMAEIMVIWA